MKSRQGPTQVDMPASVRDALDALRPVPAPDSDTWSANRVAFLDEAHVYAEEVASLPASESALASWWGRFRESVALVKTFLLRDTSPVAIALKAVLVISLALAASTGTVSAARGSLPGSLLYPLKIRIEAWEINQARTPDAIARTALAQTDVRMAEATRLQDRGDPVPEETAVRYQQQLELAVRAAGDLEEPVRRQTQAEISESVRRQLRILARTSAQVQGDAASDDEAESDPGIQVMIQTMRETQLWLGQGENQGQGQAGPQNPAHTADDPVVDDEAEQPGVGEPSMNDDDAQSGAAVPGPDGVGDGPTDSNASDDAPGEGIPDGEMPTGMDEDHDDGSPDPGPAPNQDDDAPPRSPGPGSGLDGGADSPDVDTRGSKTGSENESQSGHSGPETSGRS